MNNTGQQQQMTTSVIYAFLDVLEQFLEALEEVFPECLRVKTYKIGLSVRLSQCRDNNEHIEVGREAILAYHNSMCQYYQRCIEKDETLLNEDIDLMNNIDLRTKWTPELHPETKNAIWDYIKKLNEYSNIYSMYSNVPSGMMSTIEQMATSIAGRIHSGEMSLSDLNVNEMSQQVMSIINQDELQEFAESLQGGNMLEKMGSMYSMMTSMMQSHQL